VTVKEPSYTLDVRSGENVSRRDLEDLVDRPFDFESGQMARFLLLQREDSNNFELWIAVEHMSFDGESMRILLEDISVGYATGSLPPFSGRNRPTPGHRIGDEEQRLCVSQDGKVAQDYWANVLKSGSIWRAAPLSSCRRPTCIELMETSVRTAALDEIVSRGILSLAAGLGTSAQTIIAAAWAVAIRKNNGCTDDIPLYATINNRGEARTQRTIGPIASAALILVPEPSGETVEWLRRTAEIVHASMAYSYYPIDRLSHERPEHGQFIPDDCPILLLDVTTKDSKESILTLEDCSVEAAEGFSGHLTLFALILAVTLAPRGIELALVHPSGMISEGDSTTLLKETVAAAQAIVAESSLS
jgi:hypothetical protein